MATLHAHLDGVAGLYYHGIIHLPDDSASTPGVVDVTMAVVVVVEAVVVEVDVLVAVVGVEDVGVVAFVVVVGRGTTTFGSVTQDASFTGNSKNITIAVKMRPGSNI